MIKRPVNTHSLAKKPQNKNTTIIYPVLVWVAYCSVQKNMDETQRKAGNRKDLKGKKQINFSD